MGNVLFCHLLHTADCPDRYGADLSSKENSSAFLTPLLTAAPYGYLTGCVGRAAWSSASLPQGPGAIAGNSLARAL